MGIMKPEFCALLPLLCMETHMYDVMCVCRCMSHLMGEPQSRFLLEGGTKEDLSPYLAGCFSQSLHKLNAVLTFALIKLG